MRFYRAKTKRRIVNRPEQDMQRAFVRWFYMQYPGKLIWHTPNAAKRSVVEGRMNKELGVLAGVPDIFIAEPSKYYHGLFIEFKAKGNVVRRNRIKKRLYLN